MSTDPMVQYEAGERPIPLSKFFEANADGIDEAEQGEIRATLARGEVYHGGGGAAAEWELRSGFRLEFPDFESAIPPVFLSAPWSDHSWHNDATPSFSRAFGADGHEVHVFVDELDPAKRWDADISGRGAGPRFSVQFTDREGAFGDGPAFDSDDLDAVLAFIEAPLETLTAEYEAWLAARPQYAPQSAGDLWHEIMGEDGRPLKDMPADKRADVIWLQDFCRRWENVQNG